MAINNQSVQLQQYETYGDVPAARFGHTLTMVSPTKAVLFGGAIGDSGKFIITNELYLHDFESNKWTKLQQFGNIPSQRAAHASCLIDSNQVIVFGGAASGGGGLSGDDLFLLDMRKDQLAPQWHIIPIQGPTPGKRYGHSMVFFKPYLIVFGGNTGSQPVNDVWILNIEQQPYQWIQHKNDGQKDWPPVRVYHSAALCQTGSANGMMVIFGGRTSDQSALNDTWGLRRHRDGKWDWVKAPYKNTLEGKGPVCRYQHWINFVGPLMLVMGGRTNANDDTQHSLEIYDTESSDWYRIKATNRYRHTILILENKLYMHGGFEPESPNKPLDSMISINLHEISQIYPKLKKGFGPTDKKLNQDFQQNQNQQQQQQQQQQNILKELNHYQNQQTQNIRQNNNNNNNNAKLANQTFNGKSSNIQNMPQQIQPQKLNGKHNNGRSVTPMKLKQQQLQAQMKQIRLSNQAVIADQENNGYFTKVPVQQLQEESKKLCAEPQQDFQYINDNEELSQLFIQTLLRPNEWKPNEIRVPFRKDYIIKLCSDVYNIMENQATLIKLRVPLKIFGSIHGRFNELLRFFNDFGIPYEHDGNYQTPHEFDIEKFDYLFLGNYCDRGLNSIEVILLLFALKVKYPEQVHLLRGAHEDRRMNKLYGLAEECSIRLGEDINDLNSVYQHINKVFDMMPLGALIEEKMLCVSSGVGKSIQYVHELDNIERPISNLWDPYNQLANEILWTQYTEQEINTHPNTQRDIFKTNNVQKFGEVKLRQFLNENNLNMIIRSGTPCQDGFETNSTGQIMTLFSCPDYGGKSQNSGACLKITKNFQIIPYTLQPTQFKQGTWLTPENQIKSNIKYTEQEIMNKRRTLTPPKRNLVTKM